MKEHIKTMNANMTQQDVSADSDKLVSLNNYLLGITQFKRKSLSVKWRQRSSKSFSNHEVQSGESNAAKIIDIGSILDKKIQNLLQELSNQQWRLAPTDVELVEYFRQMLPTDNTRLKINQLRAIQRIKQINW